MTNEHTPHNHNNEGGNNSPSQGQTHVPNVDHMTTLILNNSVAMPAIGLGVFQTPPDETRAAVSAALETGYRHIDTAAPTATSARSVKPSRPLA